MSGRALAAALSSSTVIGPSASRSASRRPAIAHASWTGMWPTSRSAGIRPILRARSSEASPERLKQCPQRARRIGVVADGAKRWPAGAVVGAGRTPLVRERGHVGGRGGAAVGRSDDTRPVRTLGMGGRIGRVRASPFGGFTYGGGQERAALGVAGW